MTKTLDDYLNDPALADEPEALREVHAIRLKIHDETKDMTPTERTAYFHNGAMSAHGKHTPEWAGAVQ
jgi:hypothetical protein